MSGRMHAHLFSMMPWIVHQVFTILAVLRALLHGCALALAVLHASALQNLPRISSWAALASVSLIISMLLHENMLLARAEGGQSAPARR
jgi:hypothetical protein